MPAYEHDTAVDLGGVVAKYVRLTINSAWGSLPQAGLAEVRFFSVPVQARLPEPAMDATGVALDPTLSWRPGREAASHVVYFGADADAVADGVIIGSRLVAMIEENLTQPQVAIREITQFLAEVSNALAPKSS